MQKSLRASLLFLCFLLLCLTGRPSMAKEIIPIPIGVILDLNSSLGSMALSCVKMGLMDFYSHNAHYATRLDLQIRDSQNDAVTAASAALDLIKNEKVHAILGPENSEQAKFVIELGDKAQVPVIWLSTTGPSLFPPRTPFFIRTNQSHCFQFKAIAAIVEAFGWQAIIPILDGSDLIPCLTDALKEMDARVPYISVIDPHSEESEILKELNKLKGMQTHVFLVHMTFDLGSKLIRLAQREEMMREGYAWIVTQGLSALIDPKASQVKGYMQGALGVRPMVHVRTNAYKTLEGRWKVMNNSPLTLFGLWAYDTIEALAIAVEKAGIVNSTFHRTDSSNKSSVDLADIGMYDTGPKLRNSILATNFRGQSGNFNLDEGQLKPSVLEVYNVIGNRERIIGYWSPQRGLVQNYSEVGEPISKYKLKEPMWPGDTMEEPTKLKIGVPKKHFTEFVDVVRQSPNGRPHTSGLAFDVFLKVLDVLPFPLPYEFVPLTNESGLTAGTYDELLCQIKEKKLDAIIGDITIVANRTKCVDFTLPYLDSSVSMVVRVRPTVTSSWILLEPFDWLLWLILGGIFVGATIIIIILERRKEISKIDINPDEGQKEISNETASNPNEGKKDTSNQTVTQPDEGKKVISTEMVMNPFSIYLSDHKDLASRLSRWMVILTSFLFIIVVQVYTANLTSLLTERTMPKPSFTDVEGIKSQNHLFVGYQRESWVKGLLIEQIGFKESQLKAYGTREEYNEALSNGTQNGGVDAIFDETPYLKLFLSKYGSYYDMAGPIYKAGGFGFAFPQKSSLVSYFSNAILNVTQDVETFQALMNKYSLPTTIGDASKKESSNRRSLGIKDFGGLFPVVLYTLALIFILSILKYFCPSASWWLREKFKSIRLRDRK